MDKTQFSIAMHELGETWVRLYLGSPLLGVQADEAAAAALKRGMDRAYERRAAGQLDEQAFLRWACQQEPSLVRRLSGESAPPPTTSTAAAAPLELPPRRTWAPPPPPVPAPSPAHAAVAARIARSG